jgi:hypothetical protein
MTLKTTIGNVQERLLRIYRELSGERRVDLKSQMCRMWKDPTIEIVFGSDELAVLENEFGIKFDDDSAQDLYETNLGEAAEHLKTMILAQRTTPHDPDELINTRLILLTASLEPAVAQLAQSVRALATPPMRKLRRWQTLAANDPTSFLLLEKMGLTPDYYYDAKRFGDANDSDDASCTTPF